MSESLAATTAIGRNLVEHTYGRDRLLLTKKPGTWASYLHRKVIPDHVVVRIGSRVYLDRDAFELWLESRVGAPPVRRGGRRKVAK